MGAGQNDNFNYNPYYPYGQNAHVANVGQSANRQPANAPSHRPHFNSINNYNRKIAELVAYIQNRYRNVGNSNTRILPKGVGFANQDRNEVIIVLTRQHWSFNIGWVISNIFYSLIPIILMATVLTLNITIPSVSPIGLLVLVSFWYSLIISNIIRNFFDWYFDPYFITSQRIVHYEFKPFSLYTIKEGDIHNVRLVKERARGFLSGIWGYGDVIVSVEATAEEFQLSKIPDATLVRNIIADTHKLVKTLEL